MQRKILIGTIIAIFAFSFLISNGFGFVCGYDVVGSATNIGVYVVLNNYTLTVPSGYMAQVNSISVYCSNSSANRKVLFGIWDDNLALIYNSGNVSVNGVGWASEEVENLELLGGNYWIGCAYDTDVTRYEVLTSAYQGGYHEGFHLDDPLVYTDFGTNRVSLYFEYEFVPLGGDPAVWAGVYTFGLVALLGVTLIMFKMKIPILMLAFGVLGMTIPIGLWTEANILFSPFLQMTILIASLILTAYSFILYRSN